MNDFIYFDSAATSIKPKEVLEAEAFYNSSIIMNVNRGSSLKNYEASNIIEKVRKRVSENIGCNKPNEIIFTGNASESINLVARSFIENNITKDTNIVITSIEHHSNFAPWIELAKRKNIECRVVELKNYRIDYKDLENKIDNNTLLTAVTGMSNLTGEITDIKRVVKLCKKNSSYILIDGAQYIVHNDVDVTSLDIDFFTFSAHKLFGPFGLGVLYGREKLLNQFTPLNYGGNMVSYIDKNGNIHYKDLPHRLEVGTRNPGAIYAFNASLDFIERHGKKNLEEISYNLGCYLYKELKKISGIKIYSIPGSIISFNIDGVHPHDASDFFDNKNIIVRVGNLCASPFFMNLEESGVIRVSLAYFNNKYEIDKLISTIKEIKDFFL